MTFLGILLIIAGVGCLFASVILGLILIALGCICIASSSNKKNAAQKAEKEKSETASKEEWILAKTKEYMDQGMTPSDAKVKAEVDYSLSKKEEKKD